MWVTCSKIFVLPLLQNSRIALLVYRVTNETLDDILMFMMSDVSWYIVCNCWVEMAADLTFFWAVLRLPIPCPVLVRYAMIIHLDPKPCFCKVGIDISWFLSPTQIFVVIQVDIFTDLWRLMTDIGTNVLMSVTSRSSIKTTT